MINFIKNVLILIQISSCFINTNIIINKYFHFDKLSLYNKKHCYINFNKYGYMGSDQNKFEFSFKNSFLKIQNNQIFLENNTKFKNNLNIKKQLVIKGLKQWFLNIDDSFENYKKSEKYKCVIYEMLGGYCNENIKKGLNFKYKLKKHSFVKIEIQSHILDFWTGEMLLISLKEDTKLHTIYSKSFDNTKISKGFNVCGGTYKDNDIVKNIEILIPHNEENLELNISSNLLDDTCLRSFGISNIKVWVL